MTFLLAGLARSQRESLHSGSKQGEMRGCNQGFADSDRERGYIPQTRFSGLEEREGCC